MRHTSLCSLLASLIFGWSLSAVISSGQEVEDIKGTIKTEHGKRYRDVEVLQRDPHGITFRHAKGIAKIPFSEFSESIQKKYQYDKDSALRFLKEHASVDELQENRGWEVTLQRRAAAIQFLPEAYTSYIGSTPITYGGPTFIEARREAEYCAPPWVYPAPVNVPFEMYLWRQLSVQQHLSCVASHVHRPLSGYGDVRQTYRKGTTYPRVVYESVPAIGFGRGTPAITGD